MDLTSCPDVRSFNFSAYDSPGLPEHTGISWKDALKIFFYSLLLVVAVCGNTVVILVVYYNQSMRSTINYYLVNLAGADILIACCCMWVHLVNDLTKPGGYVLGAFMCKFSPFAQMTSLTSSVLTLAVISCDRFVAVMYPLRVRIIQQRPTLVITIIWVLSMSVSVPFLVYRQLLEFKWRNLLETQCMEMWPTRSTFLPSERRCVVTMPEKQIYYTFVTVFLFFLPIVVMMSTYCMIVWRLWASQVPGERSDTAVTNQARSKKKVIKIVFIVLIVFIICWMPLQIVILYTTYVQMPAWYEMYSFLAYFVAYSNSAINPVIYGGLNANYRQGIRAILRCQPRSQFKLRARFRYGGTMTTTVTSSCKHKENNGSSFIHDPTQVVEMKYF